MIPKEEQSINHKIHASGDQISIQLEWHIVIVFGQRRNTAYEQHGNWIDSTRQRIKSGYDNGSCKQQYNIYSSLVYVCANIKRQI